MDINLCCVIKNSANMSTALFIGNDVVSHVNSFKK